MISAGLASSQNLQRDTADEVEESCDDIEVDTKAEVVWVNTAGITAGTGAWEAVRTMVELKDAVIVGNTP